MTEQVYVGQPTQEDLDRQLVDYWGFEERKRFFLPDNIQYIEYKIMTEGDKARYQRATNRDLTISRNTGDAKLKADPAADRQELLKVTVTGWKMYRKGPEGFAEVPFSIGTPGKQDNSMFGQWLNGANPRIVEDLEREIRKANPWLLGDMSPEDIRREIANLEEMLKVAEEREAGKTNSDDK